MQPWPKTCTRAEQLPFPLAAPFAYITNWKYDTQLYASVDTFGLTITLICIRFHLCMYLFVAGGN